MIACCKVAVSVQHSGTGRARAVNCTEVEVCGMCGMRVGQAGWADSVTDYLRLTDKCVG